MVQKMLFFKRRDMDMLNGSIADKFLIFALPLAFTGMLEQLFNTADTMVLGRFVGKSAMAAVGNNAMPISLLVMLLLGLSLGGNVVIAQRIGAGNEKRASRAVHTAIIMSLFMGAILLAAGEVLTGLIMNMLGVPAEILPMAELYLRIYFLGLPALAIYNFESAIFRSNGDSHTPLYSLMVAALLNIVLNLLTVVVFDWGVAGVVGATVIANYVNAAILWRKLRHSESYIRLEYRKLRYAAKELKEIIRIGLPAGVQGMIFCLSNLVVQSAINSLGADVMAASAAAFAIEINVYCFLSAIGQATTTFIGQNFGAKNIERCFQITKIALLSELAVMLFLGGLTTLFAKPLLGIFIQDAWIIELGVIRIVYVTLLQFLNGVTEVLSGTMRGYGYSTPPAMIALVTICGTRIIWVYTVFAAAPAFSTLLLTYPASWAITGAILFVVYMRYRRRLLSRFVTPVIA